MQRLHDIMTPSPATVRISDSVVEAARLMRDEDVGSVPVMDEGALAGIITDRDITIKVVAEGLDATSTTVGEHMSAHPVTGRPDMTLKEAAELMGREQIRRLPVVEQNRLVGIISLGDLALEHQNEDDVEDALEEISEPAR
jgi:CBS domain-containing protein